MTTTLFDAWADTKEPGAAETMGLNMGVTAKLEIALAIKGYVETRRLVASTFARRSVDNGLAPLPSLEVFQQADPSRDLTQYWVYLHTIVHPTMAAYASFLESWTREVIAWYGLPWWRRLSLWLGRHRPPPLSFEDCIQAEMAKKADGDEVDG